MQFSETIRINSRRTINPRFSPSTVLPSI